ncbi:CTD small phosphatase-like protein [Actinidia chinensis var. chinensis]|uniref:CTD small phosphatase-like protein n=1 Tax=Actinidia chinensis var. chinensis TaxID=1590841 RepID=A0A2R6QAE9_ACTCC|nr:CTD small phosphatase-like protein [Actinidia chinensis var. chinensis]
MPSLKMKTKSTTGCSRDKNGLRVCQKSNMISKNSCSHVPISQHVTEFDAGIQNSEDVSLSNKAHAQESKVDKAIDHHELLVEENLQFQKHLSPLTDSSTAERMESTPPPCASNLETIFSPILESVKVHSEAEVNNDAGLPIEGNSDYDDITDSTCLLDYKCDESSKLFDVAEECMILPFLEDTMEASSYLNGRTCKDTILDSDDSSLYLAIHQLRSCNQELDVDPYSDSNQLEFFDPHMFIRNLSDLSDVPPNFQPNILPNEIQKTKSITLVLDLDETLVHSTLEHFEEADFTFPVFFNMEEHTVYVKQRPYLRMFLERVAEMFEIVVFTASQSIYAEQLLDILDPDGKLISRRAYRESCIFSDGSYTKDLTVLGVDLAKVAIIDNSPQVFRLQVNNGIPIKSWFDDPSDCALISLIPFLETLVDADDVRPTIAKRFGGVALQRRKDEWKQRKRLLKDI